MGSSSAAVAAAVLAAVLWRGGMQRKSNSTMANQEPKLSNNIH